MQMNYASYLVDLKLLTIDWKSSETAINNTCYMLLVYYVLVVFGLLFQFIMAYDAILRKSMLQYATAVVFNWALATYTIVQSSQASDILSKLSLSNAPDNLTVHPTKTIELAITITMFCFCPCLTFLGYKLYKVFGWSLYKELGADVEVKSQLIYYNMYMLLMKLDSYFFLGFALQYVILIQFLGSGGTNNQTIITACVSLPGTVLALITAYYAIRKESYFLMTSTILVMIAGIVYLILRILDIFQYPGKYLLAKNSLLIFSKRFYLSIYNRLLTVLLDCATIALCLITMIVGILNMMYFGTEAMRRLNERPKRIESESQIQLTNLNHDSGHNQRQNRVF